MTGIQGERVLMSGWARLGAKAQSIWQIRSTLCGSISRNNCHASDRRHGRITSTHITTRSVGAWRLHPVRLVLVLSIAVLVLVLDRPCADGR